MTISERILQSVLYADIFQHPMTEREVWRWIPTQVAISKKVFTVELKKLVRQKKLMVIAPFVVLPKHKKYLGVHASRLMLSQKKWKLAYKIAKILRVIPTILFVGVTGSLAVNNTDENDDIDLCVITAKKTVWITRLTTTLIVELFGHRRHPNTTTVKDTICLNMFLSEHALAMDAQHKDIYIAHELLQMIPLWERKGITKKLLRVNAWVRRQYLHAYEEKMKSVVCRLPQHTQTERLWSMFEKPVRWLQLIYMNNKRTTEVIQSDQIQFHPTNIRHKVIDTYQLACKSYKIPLDNNEK
ncbi:MAG: hypothetical protein WAV51_04250 [Microgenomates group bacterium]